MIPLADAIRKGDGRPYALGAVLLWSTSATVVVGVVGWTAPQYLFGAFLFASLALNSWSAVRLGPRQAIGALRQIGVGGLGIGFLGAYAYQMAFVASLRMAPAAEANLLNYLWPLCAAAVAVPVHREGPSPSLWAAMAIGLVGVAVRVAGPTTGDYPLRLAGDALAVGGAICWGIYTNLLSRLKVSPATAQRGFAVLAACLFGLTGLITGSPFGPFEVRSIALVAYAGIALLGLAAILWQTGVAQGPVQRIAVLGYLTPGLSTLWLAVAAGQAVSWRTLAGLALILLAALLGQKHGRG